MKTIINWLSQHKFISHSAAFLLMILAAIPMYWAAKHAAEPVIWILTILFISANGIVLATK